MEEKLKVHKRETREIMVMGENGILIRREIEYCLVSYECENGSVFGIKAQCEKDDALVFIGADYGVSERMFDTVAENSVTPVTLGDVLEDLKLEAVGEK